MPDPYEVASNSIMSVTWYATQFGQRVMTTRHYKVRQDTGLAFPGAAALDSFAEKIDELGSINVTLAGCISAAITDIQIQLQWIKPIRYAYRRYTTLNGAGTAGTDCTSPGTAGTILMQADTTGRHSRGVAHLFGVPTENSVNGFINEALIAAYATLADWWKTEITFGDVADLTAIPIIFNKAQPTFSSEITHFTVQDTVRTMRRRVVGRGA